MIKTIHWRCFHCDEVFYDREKAQLHFGAYMDAKPACQFDEADLRNMETELARYREEDTDLHRQISSLKSMHQAALMCAEESGYSKGLRDGKELVTSTVIPASGISCILSINGGPSHCTICGQVVEVVSHDALSVTCLPHICSKPETEVQRAGL